MESKSLKSLILDGLKSGKSCRNIILPGISSSYQIKNPIKNGLKSCFFEMENLESLHLSGNLIQGDLSHITTLNGKLKDLTLSYNSITGVITSNILMKDNWEYLDLSRNKFSGTLYDLSNNINRSSTYSLEVNRLSGSIPKIIQNMKNISILQGNLFYCNADRSDLPSSDENKDQYQCDSSEFDIPYYVWIALTICTLIFVFICYKYKNCNYFFSIQSMIDSLFYSIKAFFSNSKIIENVTELQHWTYFKLIISQMNLTLAI